MTSNSNKGIMCAAVLGLLVSFTGPSEAADTPKSIKGIKVFYYVEDETVLTNETACFTVVAEPSLNTKKPQSLTFQWQKNGTNIPGATGPTLLITNAQIYDVGFYSVIVSNTAKSNSSRKVGSCDEHVPGARLFVQCDTNTAISGPIQAGTGTKSCVGPYTGWVTFKNTSGSSWWTPAPGSTNCCIADLSRNNYNPPYIPVVQAVDNITLAIWCATNQVCFPVVAGHKYQFTTFIKNPMPPPGQGAQVTIDINWQ
jgi:hypothetical protein